MKKLISRLLTLTMIMSCFTAFSAHADFEPQGENVALGKTVTTGSAHVYYSGSQLVDGGFSDAADGNKWTTAYLESDSSIVYAIIDLGKAYSINGIVGEMWVDDGQSTLASATISVSNDLSFAESETIGTITYKAGKQTIEVDSAKKWRYVKVQGSAYPGRRWGLWELEVYSVDDIFVPQGENVALGKTVTAGSEYADLTYYGSKLVNGGFSDAGDGNQWTTYGLTESDADKAKAYAIIDLGKAYSINGIVGEMWVNTYSTQSPATISVSNDLSFAESETIGTITYTAGKQTIEVLDSSKKWRYVKVQGGAWPGYRWGLWELEVYSTDKFEPQGENVARGKTVTTGSAHDWYPGSQLVNGVFSGTDGNQWTTDASNGDSSKAYAIIDLGKAYSINGIVGEVWYSPGNAVDTPPTITVSNDASFAEAETVGTLSYTAGKQTIEVLDSSKKWRYVKVQGGAWQGLRFGMWELEVYSTDKFEPQGENVAFGKTVTTGSAHDWYPGSQLVNGGFSSAGDGNQWETYGLTESDADRAKAYAIIDLGKKYSINGIVGEMWVSSDSTGSKATISVSNDLSFAESETIGTIAYTAGKQTIEVLDSSKKWRYVKVQGGAWTGFRWGLWELEVYSADAPILVSGNAALNAAASAVSSYITEKESYPASNAIDGDINTPYASGYAGENANVLSIDLKNKTKISEIRFLVASLGHQLDGSYDTAYRKNFKIELSADGSDYTTVYTVGAEPFDRTWQTVSVNDDKEYRYVRISKTDGNNTNLGFDEFEVWSPSMVWNGDEENLNKDNTISVTTVASVDDSTVISEIPQDGKFAIKLSGDAYNKYDYCTIYQACYDTDMNLLGVKVLKEQVVIGGGNGAYEKIYKAEADEFTAHCKFFVWETGKMVPLAPAKGI